MAAMDRLSASETTPTRIAVVIPVLREHAALAALIGDLDSQSRTPDEIVIVSGAGDEQVSALVRRTRHRLIEAPPGRGVQLDAGARATHAETLWFVHADARLPDGACESVLQAVHSGAAGGCLRLVFQPPRPPVARCVERLVRLRIACGGMAYGDQALFCTRAAYQDCGGFPPVPLFEEVRLVRHLQRIRRFAVLETPVFVSARRWERDGWLHRSARNRWLALRHALGAAPQTLARSYLRADVTETRG